MADTIATLSPFNFNSHAVRVIVRDGNPWFVASDVCSALGYVNTSKAVGDHLDDDERSHEQLDRSRMGSKALIINESGLYALVLRSRKPEARKFAKWVTSEVLPAIRKTGNYTSDGSEICQNVIAALCGQRFLTTFDEAGKVSFHPISNDAQVVSASNLPTRITSGDFTDDPQKLNLIAVACVSRVQAILNRGVATQHWLR